ncbi:OLD family protein [Staphylococcus auricularis]|uniref:Uncharacterized protein n=1 Tax=Staphylococcus auricularis TaxID=29379 RepID=A0ABX5IEQ9_9STAP|nr:hypothetical protein [Staphylococcus auricularis]MCE5039330.1 hypothetical protein [Staphylococcus auricularis]MEB6570408.1 hypothetical protein [Staphylococcus auricularis]PTH16833.1 hypothetical protein BU607_08005 [Staphylococcus auricularis]PTH25047.1 hypothetical protein BU608_08880 [Staphylococcus auricularis]
MIWQIKGENITPVELNIGPYTSIYDEYETIEEELLEIIFQYFQKRGSNKDVITITDLNNQELISHRSYQSFVLSHELVEKEHALASSSLMNKKLNRLLTENIEIDSYFNTMNQLMSDMLDHVHCDLPIHIKRFDYKMFIKQLEFDYGLHEDYRRLIVRLEKLIPLIVEEINQQTQNKALMIYIYPESNLSPREQIRFRKLLNNLPVTLIVLTNSMHFISDNIHSMNFIKNDKQMLNQSFFESLEWDAPLDYERQDIFDSLEQFIKLYHDKVELYPTISNYKTTEIILFKAIDIYVAVRYLINAGLPFSLDLDFTLLPAPVEQYLRAFYKS